jgi:hypothetical protein
MRKTEAWWVCTKCGALIARVGKRGKAKVDQKIRKHREKCDPLAGCMMKQIEQRQGKV